MHLCQYTWLALCIYLCVICSSSAYKDVSECWNCTAGFHCSQPGRDSPVAPCDPGYYCPSGASSSQEVPCDPGTYCVGQNEEPELCPIGTFQPNYTRTHISDCINCTAGRFFFYQIMVFLLTKELGMNNFIKEAAGSKRINLSLYFVLEAQWPHGWCVCLRIKKSGFKPWLGMLCCVLKRGKSVA